MLCLLLCVGLPASSAPPPDDGKPTYSSADGPRVLKDLKDIGVFVERFPKDLLSPSLTIDAVRYDVGAIVSAVLGAGNRDPELRTSFHLLESLSRS